MAATNEDKLRGCKCLTEPQAIFDTRPETGKDTDLSEVF